MKRLAGIVVSVLIGLVVAGCVAPTVAAPPRATVVAVEEPAIPAPCRQAREVVRGFIAEMQLYGPVDGTDYEAWWNGHMVPRIAQFAADFETYAADCPAIAP